jgi:hypothetical protein
MVSIGAVAMVAHVLAGPVLEVTLFLAFWWLVLGLSVRKYLVATFNQAELVDSGIRFSSILGRSLVVDDGFAIVSATPFATAEVLEVMFPNGKKGKVFASEEWDSFVSFLARNNIEVIDLR